MIGVSFCKFFFPGCGVFVEVLRPAVLLVSDKTVYVPIYPIVRLGASGLRWWCANYSITDLDAK